MLAMKAEYVHIIQLFDILREEAVSKASTLRQ